MTPANLRRKMEDMGIDPDEIDEAVDTLAEELRDHQRDENLEALLAMGYTLDDLEKSNPYTLEPL